MVLIPYDRHFRRLWHSSFVCSPDVVAVRKLVSWSVCVGCGRIAVEKLAGPATCTLLPWVPWHHGDDVVESTANERRSSVSRSLSIRSSPTTQWTTRWTWRSTADERRPSVSRSLSIRSSPTTQWTTRWTWRSAADERRSSVSRSLSIRSTPTIKRTRR